MKGTIYIKDKYYCARLRQLQYLEDSGFHYENIQADVKDPSRKVWVYNVTSDLLEALNMYCFLRNLDIQYELSSR